MAWPPPVQPGDEILASQLDSVLQSVQTWGGDVDAGGYRLKNVVLPSTQSQATVQGQSYFIPTGGAGPRFVTVIPGAVACSVFLPASPLDGEMYWITRQDWNPSGVVQVDGQGRRIMTTMGSNLTTYQIYPLEVAAFVYNAALGYWIVVELLPSDWLTWSPVISDFDGIATATLGTVFLSRYQVWKGAVVLEFSGQVTFNGNSNMKYIKFSPLPIVTASYVTAGVGGVTTIGGMADGTHPASTGAYQNAVTTNIIPLTVLTQGIPLTVSFTIQYPIDRN